VFLLADVYEIDTANYSSFCLPGLAGKEHFHKNRKHNNRLF